MLKGKNIILGVTGGIAAYKAAALASLLVKAGAFVDVIMTDNAKEFIGPVTFEALTKNRCITDTFDRNHEVSTEHISLAKKADAFVIAPATANIIAKTANGIADDMLTTTFLACDCPKIVVPAMNTKMYDNPVTQDNIRRLKGYGITVMETAEGLLACGDTGKGKMAEPDKIMEYIEMSCAFEKDYAGKKVLITAGPTMEPVDPVRYITNHSTGKMGYALARICALRGADVTLVSGKTYLEPPAAVKTVNVLTASEMAESVKSIYEDMDIIIKAAAVADYRPKNVSSEKIKKKEGDTSIELERTEDILKFLGENRKEGQFICGFSMETQNMVENSREKLKRKKADMIIANNLKVKGAGFGGDTNVVTFITENDTRELEILSKEEVAVKIADEIIKSLA